MYVIVDPTSRSQDQSVLEVYMVMTSGQMLFTLELIMELFISQGCPDLATQRIYSMLAQTNIIKYNNAGMLTGVLEAEFLDLGDKDIIKQINGFDDSMGSWITNSIFLLNTRNG